MKIQPVNEATGGLRLLFNYTAHIYIYNIIYIILYRPVLRQFVYVYLAYIEWPHHHFLSDSLLSGDITISGSMTFTLNIDLDYEYIPYYIPFTLTCISTGGPATTVTWIRDSVNITERTETVLDDPDTAQYTHTLSVPWGNPGVYRCTVSNAVPSESWSELHVQGNI